MICNRCGTTTSASQFSFSNGLCGSCDCGEILKPTVNEKFQCTDFLVEKAELLKKNVTLGQQHNAALRMILKIKKYYPHVYSECVLKEEEDILLGEGQ